MVQPSGHSAVFLYWAATTCACGALIKGLTSDGVLSLVSSADKARHMLERGNMDAFTSMLTQDMAQVVRVFLQSQMSTFLLINWLFATYSVVALMTLVVFLGRLTPGESSSLTESLVKYCLFKLVFVGALLPPGMGEVAAWVGWFAIAGFMRIFMGVARDRLEALMAAPGASLSSHIRAVSLVLLILVHDAMACTSLLSAANATTSILELTSLSGVAAAGVASAASTPLPRIDMSRALLCAFDMTVIAVEGLKTLVRYGVHVVDLHLSAKAGDDDPSAVWEGKGEMLFHVELVSDVLIHSLTLVHYLHVWYLHGLSIHVVDAVLLLDVRAVAGSLARRLKGYAAYCAATHRLRHAFPDTRPSEPEPCSICMESMAVAKQLPCGHLFHLSCLRAWMQQGGAETFTCPNCRQPLLVDDGGPRQRPPLTRHGVFGGIRFIHTWMRNACVYCMLRFCLAVLELGPWRSSSDPVVDIYLRHLRLALRRTAAYYAPSRTALMLGNGRGSSAAGRHGRHHRQRARSGHPSNPPGHMDVEGTGESSNAGPRRGEPRQDPMGWGVTWQDLPASEEQAVGQAEPAPQLDAGADTETLDLQQQEGQGHRRGIAIAVQIFEAGHAPTARFRSGRGRRRPAAYADEPADLVAHPSGAGHSAHCHCCASCAPGLAVWRVRGQTFARVADDLEEEEVQAPETAARMSGEQATLRTWQATEAGPGQEVCARSRRGLFPPAPDLPTWSGGVVDGAQRLARAAHAIHSTASHAGCNMAAVAGHPDDGDEICSGRRDDAPVQ